MKWVNDEKVCTQCGILKPRSEYYKSTRDGNVSKCKICTGINRENRRLKKLYGITLEEYYKILEEQNHKCLICGSNENSGWGKFHVDHNHKTNKIRGLLCSNCNTAIGLVKENPFVLLKMIKYLKGEKEDEKIPTHEFSVDK